MSGKEKGGDSIKKLLKTLLIFAVAMPILLSITASVSAEEVSAYAIDSSS